MLFRSLVCRVKGNYVFLVCAVNSAVADIYVIVLTYRKSAASGANELTVVEGCVIAVGGAGIFKTANTILTAANLDAGSTFAVGKDYYRGL